MIPSFHAVFGLRQGDKTAKAKVIDYNDQVIMIRENLLFRGIPSPMYFQLSRKRQCTAGTVALHCGSGCSALRLRWVKLVPKSPVLFWIREQGGEMHL